MRLQRHAPVESRERRRQPDDQDDDAGDVLHLAAQARVARRVLLGRPAVQEVRQKEPRGEVDDAADDEERDVQVRLFVLGRLVARDPRGVRPLVERAPTLVHEERDDDGDEEDEAERERPRGRLEETPARQGPSAAGHVAERQPGEAADGNPRAEEEADEVRAEDLYESAIARV